MKDDEDVRKTKSKADEETLEREGVLAAIVLLSCVSKHSRALMDWFHLFSACFLRYNLFFWNKESPHIAFLISLSCIARRYGGCG